MIDWHGKGVSQWHVGPIMWLETWNHTNHRPLSSTHLPRTPTQCTHGSMHMGRTETLWVKTSHCMRKDRSLMSSIKWRGYTVVSNNANDGLTWHICIPNISKGHWLYQTNDMKKFGINISWIITRYSSSLVIFNTYKLCNSHKDEIKKCFCISTVLSHFQTFERL